MSNAYFFTLIAFFFFGMSFQKLIQANAQTEKLSPSTNRPVVSGNSKKNKSNITGKLRVESTSVPNLGSSQTEAGVGSYAAGIPNNYVQPSTLAPYSAPQVPYRTSDQFGGSKTNIFSSVAGVMNIFGMAASMSQRINPTAQNGPMFINECKNCGGINAEVVTADPYANDIDYGDEGDSEEAGIDGSSGDRDSVGYGDSSSGHNEDEILSLVKNESIKPFQGISEPLAETYIKGIVTSLSPFGSIVLSNSDEYKQLCPNYENLNTSQKKAFMVFLYSSIFKQTSNYDNSKIVTIGGLKKIGMCQIEYEETKKIYAEYTSKAIPESAEFYSSFAKNPLVSIDACSAKILKATENQSSGARPLKSLFPTVNFNQIGVELRGLSLCRTEGVY